MSILNFNGIKVNVGFVACVKEGYDTLCYLLKENWKPDFIITFEPSKAKIYSGYVSFDTIAEENRIPLYYVTSINSIDALNLLRDLNVDILYVIGWSEILKNYILKIPKIGTIGFHASLLPKYRGSAPVNWALINNEPFTGSTMFWMDEKVDTGKIISQEKIEISSNDNCKDVYHKVAKVNAKMIIENFSSISSKDGRFIGIDQKYRAPLMPKRLPEDGLIKWNEHSAVTLYNFIRALTKPYPGAFFYWNGKKIYIWSSTIIESTSNSENVFIKSFENNSIIVQLKIGQILLSELELENYKTLNSLNEFEILGLIPGTILESQEKVLVFVAHPDDEVLGIGGTLIEHFKKGHDVNAVIFCGRNFIHQRENKINIYLEAQKASYFLGCKTIILDYKDQELDNIPTENLVETIGSYLNKLKPNYVYTHFNGDINLDHQIIANSLNIAIRPYNYNKTCKVFCFETPSSTEWNFFNNKYFKPNCIVDISNSLDRKIEAIKCYNSELRDYPHPRSPRSLRERAFYWGSISNVKAAEPLILLWSKK